nr:GspH/FimT family pseudopilin [Caldimonas manganoxidans]
MVTIAVLAVLAVIAAPNFNDFFTRNRLASQSNELISALNLARSEAIKRGVRVTVCRTNDATAASPACAGGSDTSWANGWIVFVDNTHVGGNTAGVIDADDEVLRVFGALRASTLTANNDFARGLSFRPDGSSLGINGSGSLVTAATASFSLCLDGQGRNIEVNTMGRPRLGSTSCTG